MKKASLALAALILSAGIAVASDAGKGKKIFKRKCKSCHRLGEGTLVGPSLLGVTKRRSEEWLHKWLQDPKGMVKSGDAIATDLKKRYKKQMPHIKAMDKKANREDIIAFLKENDQTNGK